MKKKIIGLMVAGVAVFALSGCSGGGDDTVYVEPEPTDGILFLIDYNSGLGIDGVSYECYASDGTLVYDDFTLDGKFSFDIGERCFFDLDGFEGTIPNDLQPIYIADDLDGRKHDIPYECGNGIDPVIGGTTDRDGFFEYSQNAACKFYF